VTIRQLGQREFVYTRLSARKRRAMARQSQRPDSGEKSVQSQTAQLPPRPDPTVLSGSIPLFFVGRNQSGFWVPIATTIDIVRRRAPLVATFIGMVIAAWRKLDSQIAHLLADHRYAIENDLFRGEYKLVSKNDDELPIPH
jgi:hypothetical protein